MTSGADFGSLKAALTRWARVSIGMYSTSTLVPLWAFSKSATTESTTLAFGSLPTSWKSHTRRVPLWSSFSEDELSEVWGAQPATTAAAATSTANLGASFMERSSVRALQHMQWAFRSAQHHGD